MSALLPLDAPVAETSLARPPLPPFTEETARLKVQMAEDAWNSRDPARCALAYAEDACLRNRGELLAGRQAIKAFLMRKWAREHQYRLKKCLFAFSGNRIAVCLEYEYHDAQGQWWRAYGQESWIFDERGLMARAEASLNDVAIEERDRQLV